MNLLAAAGSTDAIIGDSPAMQEVFKSIGRVASTDGSSDPAALLWRLNHYHVENTSHHFVTMFLAVIDPLGGQLVYASAGHPAWLLEAGGQTQQLEGLSISWASTAA